MEINGEQDIAETRYMMVTKNKLQHKFSQFRLLEIDVQ
jgi:hypothetical protein